MVINISRGEWILAAVMFLTALLIINVSGVWWLGIISWAPCYALAFVRTWREEQK